ncbi:MAG: hypothetical protein COT85_01995 [Chlamydiae bacterium CG10_big_fil_rev_8_21_14_0_10_42_34]|nr:MAG: hypothetical protein COT85_01995 [Chlamydiae bacterium CG10_big_fil_rev_8_21_14_0_10_42_34]
MIRTLLVFCFACSSLVSAIFEISHFSEVPNYIDEDCVLLLDIDDTLIVPVQTLGSGAWFDYRLKSFLNEGCDYRTAVEKTLPEWEAIRHLTKMRLVEEETAKVLSDLQEKQVPIMGVTFQGLALATRTVMQLNDLRVDLCKTSPSKEDHCLSVQNHTVIHRQGILFTSGRAKGESFFQLCGKIGMTPKKIVVVDDKLSHLQNFEKETYLRGVEFVGLRYGALDEQCAAFSKEVAEYQFSQSSLKHLISDEEAKMKIDLSK